MGSFGPAWTQMISAGLAQIYSQPGGGWFSWDDSILQALNFPKEQEHISLSRPRLRTKTLSLTSPLSTEIIMSDRLKFCITIITISMNGKSECFGLNSKLKIEVVLVTYDCVIN